MRRLSLLLLVWSATAALAFAQRAVTIEGAVFVQASRRANPMMTVHIEGQASERIALTYPNDAGRFAFRDVVFQRGEIYYIVADAEGFEPYRERLDRQVDLSSGGFITILLEAPAFTSVPAGGEARTVDVSELITEIPEEATREYERATSASDHGDTDGSIEHLQRALELAPDYPQARNHLGRQYLVLGRIEDAQAQFERAQELKPAWVIPMVNLGTLHYQVGERLEAAGDEDGAMDSFRLAVDTLRSAVRIDPLSPTAHYMAGTALYKISDLPNAEAMLHRALELNPELDEARLPLINVYSRQGRLPEAYTVVTEYLARNPAAPESSALERVRSQLEALISDPN